MSAASLLHRLRRDLGAEWGGLKKVNRAGAEAYDWLGQERNMPVPLTRRVASYWGGLYGNPDPSHPYKAWPPKELLRSADNLTGAWMGVNPSTYPLAWTDTLGLSSNKVFGQAPEWRQHQVERVGAELSMLPVASLEGEAAMPQAENLTRILRSHQRIMAPPARTSFGYTLYGHQPYFGDMGRRLVRTEKAGARELRASLNRARRAERQQAQVGFIPTGPGLPDIVGGMRRHGILYPDFVHRLTARAQMLYPDSHLRQAMYTAHRLRLHEITAGQAAFQALPSVKETAKADAERIAASARTTVLHERVEAAVHGEAHRVSERTSERGSEGNPGPNDLAHPSAKRRTFRYAGAH